MLAVLIIKKMFVDVFNNFSYQQPIWIVTSYHSNFTIFLSLFAAFGHKIWKFFCVIA